MNIILSADTQKLLEDRLKTGNYRSADDVLHAALEALNELTARGIDPSTLDALDRAEDEIERGEVVPWKDVREQTRAKFLGK